MQQEQPHKEYKTMTIGKVKITVIAFSLLIIGVVFSVFCLFFLPSSIGVIASLLIMLGFIFAAYNINCVLVGHCIIWAYVLMIVYLLNVVLVVMRLVSLKQVLGAAHTKPTPLASITSRFKKQRK